MQGKVNTKNHKDQRYIQEASEESLKSGDHHRTQVNGIKLEQVTFHDFLGWIFGGDYAAKLRDKWAEPMADDMALAFALSVGNPMSDEWLLFEEFLRLKTKDPNVRERMRLRALQALHDWQP